MSKAQNWSTLDAVSEIATSMGATPSHVALNWVINPPGVTAPIIGARTLKYLDDNLCGADLKLEESFTARLDEVSAPTPDEYPYGPFIEKQRGRYINSSKQTIMELF